MKLNSKILGILILVVVFGGIAISSALGYWNTEGGGGGYGQGGKAGVESGDEAAEMVRGRTTFQDLLDLGLTQEVIEQIIGTPMPDPSVRVNLYCEEQGLDFESIRAELEQALAQRDS